MSRKNNEERSNPLKSLLQSTQSQESTAMPPPSAQPQQSQEQVPSVQQQSTPVRPKPPETRQRTGLRYDQRYAKESIVVDRRLLTYYFQLVETYPNKTVMATEMIVRACKERGIPLPEDWDKQPFPE